MPPCLAHPALLTYSQPGGHCWWLPIQAVAEGPSGSAFARPDLSARSQPTLGTHSAALPVQGHLAPSEAWPTGTLGPVKGRTLFLHSARGESGKPMCETDKC